MELYDIINILKNCMAGAKCKVTTKYFLDYFFEEQKSIQQALDSKIGKKISPASRNTQYREHCIFTIEEIIEGLRNINHKPWKKTQEKDNLNKLKDELIDEFRFFLNRCILVGMDANEFSERFDKSMKKTKRRIKNKY
jgi:NTP pyrophosphatase (non-canonical NTP hydrolase)